MTHKQVLVMLLVTIFALTGCGLVPGPAQINSTTRCCPPWSPAELLERHHVLSCKFDSDLIKSPKVGGFSATGGDAWVAKDGEYCVGEGSVVIFPDGHRIEGPERGNYKMK